jgi:ubiquinone/menaquinone biosynthesis C-methylase UbiE
MRKLTPKEFRAWNEEIAKKYTPEFYHHHPNIVVRYIESKRVCEIINFLGLQEDDRLLEVGCGTGNILESLDSKKTVGIDLSKYLLQKTRQKNIPNLQLINANGENLPFKDHCFNKAICSEVIEHVQNPQSLLTEIGRVLDSKGRLVISIPNEDLINLVKWFLVKVRLFGFLFPQQKNKLKEHLTKNDLMPEFHLHKFNFNILKNMLLKSRFHILRYKAIPFGLLPLRYVVECEKKLD